MIATILSVRPDALPVQPGESRGPGDVPDHGPRLWPGWKPSAPGQLATHYAPAKPLRLDATAPQAGEWLIGFGPIAGDDTLSASGDLVEAAARLFDALHRADASSATSIAVAPIPQDGIGAAINDRLSRGACR